MGKRATGMGLLALTAWLSSGVAVPATDQKKPSRATEEQLDEVQVIGTRAQLDEMRKAINALEDRFYERYNDLNTDDDFDIHCEMEAKIGTRLKLRSCRALYQIAAFVEEGRDAFEIRQNVQEQLRLGTPRPMLPRSPPTPSTLEIQRRQEEFRQNMREVAARDPHLVQILKQRAETLERYDAARRKLFGRSPRQMRETEVQGAMP